MTIRFFSSIRSHRATAMLIFMPVKKPTLSCVCRSVEHQQGVAAFAQPSPALGQRLGRTTSRSSAALSMSPAHHQPDPELEKEDPAANAESSLSSTPVGRSSQSSISPICNVGNAAPGVSQHITEDNQLVRLLSQDMSSQQSLSAPAQPHHSDQAVPADQ